MNVELENIDKCPLCGSDKYSLWKDINNWLIVSCDKCSLKRLNPRPSERYLAQLYSADYFKERKPQDLNKATRQMNRSFKRRYKSIRKFSNGRTLLDIGCGEGKWCLYIKDFGYNVTGIDISAEAGKLKDVKIIVGTIFEHDFTDKYDVITMFHCLEHMPDPIAALKKVNQLLTDNGILVIEVPNSGSFDAIKYDSNWDGWKLPYHLFHFDQTTLIRALNENGFTPVYWRFDSSKWLRTEIKKIPIIKLLHGIVSHFKTGTSMFVVCKKSHRL